MKYKSTLLFLWALVLCFFNFDESYGAKMFSIGEQLEYEVSYMGVPLAKVTIKSKGSENVDGKPRTHVVAHVNTYSHVPMVDVNAMLETWFDKEYNYSVQFVRNLKLGDKAWEYQKVQYDYKNKLIRNKKWVKKKLKHNSKKKIQKGERLFDPLALFCYTRMNSFQTKKDNVRTVMDHNIFFCHVNYTGKKEKISISAIDHDVKSVYVKADANWEAGYGLTGEVEGWYSDDKYRVPLKAKIDFMIGKITVELSSWKILGWRPPKA